MRIWVERGFGETEFILRREGEASDDSAFIEIGEGIKELHPLFREYAGEHICIVSHEEERSIFRGGPYSHGCIPRRQPRNIWKQILWGKLANDWEYLPEVASFVTVEDRKGALPGNAGNLLTVLRQEFSRHFIQTGHTILYLGDNACQAFMEESSNYRGSVTIDASVWSNILLVFGEPLVEGRIPESVTYDLARKKQETQKKLEELEGKRNALFAEYNKMVQAVVDTGNELHRFTTIGIP